MNSSNLLSPKQIDCIQNQEFSDSAPGSLLKDFTSLLEIIGSEGIKVSKSNYFFALKHLQQINEMLTHPLDINLKRSQQKSYPHIHGLYLLLRASGLSSLRIEKKQTRLILNQEVLANWNALNAIERYFALFEAWWQRGSVEIIAQRENCWFEDAYLSSSIQFFYQSLRNGLEDENGLTDHLRYRPGFHYLALRDYSGL